MPARQAQRGRPIAKAASRGPIAMLVNHLVRIAQAEHTVTPALRAA